MKLSYLIAAIVLCVLMAACSKDKFTTKPKLELKSINGEAFPSGAPLSFKFNVTDREGDIQDTMWVQKISYSCPDVNVGWPGAYKIPDFTGNKNLKVELDVNYCYNCSVSPYPVISGCQQRTDSCYFKFWMKDKAGNVSDTVTTGTLKLLNE
jgi:hypothetical protein